MAVTLDDALGRLDAAVGLIEAAVARRLDAERRRGDLETELQIMQDDRARLAMEVDGAAARIARTDAAVADIERRVGRAIGTLRDILARAEPETAED